MNPLDLPGPAFLALYMVLACIALVGAFLLRRALRRPGGEPPAEALSLHAYQIAYLAGGPDRAVDSAIALLVWIKVLAFDSVKKELKCSKELPGTSHPLEKAVYQGVSPAGTAVGRVRAAALNQAKTLSKRLTDCGLLVREKERWKGMLWPALLLWALALFGCLKIQVGISRHRPVEFLVLFCIATVVVSLFFLFRRVLRSRRGDVALTRLRESNAALEYTARRRGDSLGGNDVAIALSLFGVGVLDALCFTDLRALLKPPVAQSSFFSGGGCGGGGCGGGGCGGGGCGGGGCGGGGCGGCGG